MIIFPLTSNFRASIALREMRQNMYFFYVYSNQILGSQAAFPNGPNSAPTWPNRGPTGAQPGPIWNVARVTCIVDSKNSL